MTKDSKAPAAKTKQPAGSFQIACGLF